MLASSIVKVSLWALGAHAILEAPNKLDLLITGNATVQIPPTLYGYMWEDINHSGDGGLYAELLQNRAFQAVQPGTLNALNAWQQYNGARLSVTNKTPGVSSALPNSLEALFPAFVAGPIGFENTGYWGIKIQAGWTYTGSFYAKSNMFTGPITASLKSAQGTNFASKTLAGVGKKWKKFEFELNPLVSASDNNNVFSVTVDGKAVAGKTIYFGLFSLFPPTFKGRPNGMRIDLADTLFATHPSVWRFPGGNNLEGHSFETRWKWNETIGLLEDRPGRVGDWGYVNTDGLGLLEYLNWAEDLEAEPILGVWAGISIANYSDLTTWPVVSQSDLQPYIDDALDYIEFVVGNPETTKGGKLRASLGRRDPYALRYVEIGNEDQFQPASYAAYRWKAFVSAIGAKFPTLEFIATTLPETALEPAYLKIDFHQYNSPNWFMTNAFMFDEYPRNGTQFFVGEYAVTSINETAALPDLDHGRLAYPTLEGAVAEAAFMTGLERNSDVVFAAAYAPSFQHIANYQWTPDIVTYDASSLVRSTSYYVQKLFSVNRGTHVLNTMPISSADFSPLFWVASHHNETGVVFLKVANAGTTNLDVRIIADFNIAGFGSATSLSSPSLSPISGIFNISNTLDEPNQIVPVDSTFAIPEINRFNYTFPAMSVTVITLQA